MPIAALPPPPQLRAEAIALFLDVDGTLVEIEREPGAVHVPERLCADSGRSRAGRRRRARPGQRPLAAADRPVVRAAPPERRRPARSGAAQSAPRGGAGEARPGDPRRCAPALERLRRPASGRAARGQGPDPRPSLPQGSRAASRGRRSSSKDVVVASEWRLEVLEGKMVFELKPPGARQGAGDRRVHARAAVRRPPAGLRRRRYHRRGRVPDRRTNWAASRSGSAPTTARPPPDYGRQDVGAMQTWLADLLAAQAA